MAHEADQAHLVRESETPEGVSLRPHVYDGIQEYDQKLPNWWLVTFYGAIIFFAGYWFSYYQLGAYDTDTERIESQMEAIAARKAELLEQELSSLSNERLWEMSEDAVIVAAGKTTYEQTCVACHAADLSATIAGAKLPGQPLDDNEWKYGGEPMDVMEIVLNGSPDKASGMQAWEPILGPRKVAEVVAYVMSHHEPGSAVAAPDAPQPAGSP